MIYWIMVKNLDSYRSLCHEEKIEPVIFEQTDDRQRSKCHKV
jgi:hypothetical protein